jgi:hypothetical protein
MHNKKLGVSKAFGLWHSASKTQQGLHIIIEKHC